MTISVFDLFKVGIGPSSSHTVGPMKAAGMFARGLRDDGLMPQVRTVRVSLYGSLGLTGPGHGSDKAVLLGLEGEQPATVDVDAVPARLEAIARRGTIRLLGEYEIAFTVREHLEFNGDRAGPGRAWAGRPRPALSVHHRRGTAHARQDQRPAHLRDRDGEREGAGPDGRAGPGGPG